MKRFINAGFGEPIGLPLLNELKARGWQGVRQDIKRSTPLDAVMEELVASGMGAIFVMENAWLVHSEGFLIARAARMAGLKDYAIEVGNELDIMDPANYASAFETVLHGVRTADPGASIYTAGTRNTSREALAWIEAIIRTGKIPFDTGIAVHTYRGSHEPDSPLPGYASRSEEWEAVKRAANFAPIALTEIGWPDVRTSWWPCSHPLSEGQVAQYLRREFELANACGVGYAVAYQLNDGPSKDPIDHFGIRRRDGSWKPSAYAAIPAPILFT